MTQDHIVKSYDDELQQIENCIAQMGGLAEMQLTDAIQALTRRDGALAEQVTAKDRRIDDLEHQVNEMIVQLFAMRQPVASDLRAVISALKISNDIERIGDYAKNVAKRTVALSQSPAMPAIATISRMGHLVQGMIKNVLDSYLERDADKADDVRRRDLDVDQLHTSLFRELLTYMMEDPRNITPCTHLLFIAKNIERMGDHATNIAEQVHFLVRGEDPESVRPKSDNSSFTVMQPDAAPQR